MPAYDQQSMRDLAEATQYESWLLEAAFSIVEESLFPEWPDQMIYPPIGGSPPFVVFGRATILIGDWRPEFLRVGAPLIFVITFKLLDMLVEWMLGQNGQTPGYRFKEKIAALKGNPTFPPFIASRGWLQDRLIALYESLDPLRGTIIHARHFKTADGALDVSSSRGNNVGPTISLAPQAIRSLAVFMVSILRYVDGTWQPNSYREKVLRRTLDELAHLHGQPSLNQQPPHFLTTRVYFILNDPVTLDVARIQRDVSTRLLGSDVMFDVRLVALAPDGNCATSYLLPWDVLQHETGSVIRTLAELANYKAVLPTDFDVQAVARELLASPNVQRVAG